MHIYYKFGLFLIFILSISTLSTKAAPSTVNLTSSYDNNYSEYYEDYYDENEPDQRDSNVTVKTNYSGNMVMTTPRTILIIPTTSRISISLNNYINNNQILEPKCPKLCFCLENFKRIHCSGVGLAGVPKNLPNTTLIIDLSQNNIRELLVEDFVNIPQVREINLSGNKLNFIDKAIFDKLINLQRLELTDNKLKYIDPATFSGISNLIDLDISNNSILLKNTEPFLIQPGLIKLACRNCSWTQLYDNTFSGLTSLQSLNLDFNNFDRKINVKAFSPLQNIIKLWLPDLEPETVTELCSLLTAIDNINFEHFAISCFELVLGTSYNDSIIVITDPPFIQTEITPASNKVSEAEISGGSTQTEEIQEIITQIKSMNATITVTTESLQPKEVKIDENKMEPISISSKSTNSTVASRIEDVINYKNLSAILTGNVSTSLDDMANRNVEHNNIKTIVKANNSLTEHISQDTVNILLICIIIIAIVGIIIGIICRKDIGGIKTKCCRTKKPDQKDQVHPTEEIPLNKLT